MFSTLPSSDHLPAYTWPESELAELNAYVARLPSATSSSTAPIAHNGPTKETTEAKQARHQQFEQLARENLRGLYLAQLKCLLRATDDPRVTKAHGQVLGRIILRTDRATGMSYPGREWMAGDITYYDDDFQPQHYHAQTIGNLVADLKRWGYLGQDKRGIDGKGRAVSHYITLTPDLAYLQEQITAWCLELRDKPKRERPRPDVLAGEYVSNDVCRTDGEVRQKADVLGEHRSNGSDVLFNHPKSPRESRKHAPYLEESYLEEERGTLARPGADAPCLPLPLPTNGTNGHAPQDQPGRLPGKRTPRRPAARTPTVLILDGCFTTAEKAFGVFWAAFPPGRKRDRGGALDTFTDIITGKHRKRKATVQEIVDGARRYAASRPDPDYVPLPTTWLNGGRWGDDVGPQLAVDADAQAARDQMTADIERLRREEDGRC
jgi:hypothetical protein